MTLKLFFLFTCIITKIQIRNSSTKLIFFAAKMGRRVAAKRGRLHYNACKTDRQIIMHPPSTMQAASCPHRPTTEHLEQRGQSRSSHCDIQLEQDMSQ